MIRYLTEAVGTFLFVLTIGLVVLSGSAFAPLAIGSALMVVVYAGGHVSGGHYNPAVSLGAVMAGALPKSDLLPYMIAQIGGAFLATFAVRAITGSTFAPAPAADASTVAVLLVEFLFTFLLVLTVLNAAVASQTKGNSFYGLAIGFSVVVGAFAGGGISGGAFNPAVGTGPILAHAFASGGSLSALWIYLAAPFAGGAVAALFYGWQQQGLAASR